MPTEPSIQTGVSILGVFVADATYHAARQPQIGETVLGNAFALGPGGKGSNQAVAAAKAGAEVTFISRLGDDAFARMAFEMWDSFGINTRVEQLSDSYTGSAFIYIQEGTGDNAIIVCPGAAATLSAAYVESVKDSIIGSRVFITQLEQPIEAAMKALSIAREHNVTTILNTAPAESVPDAIFPLCDYVTPNETETEQYTGIPVKSVEDARKAANVLLDKGVGTALITLGERGALLHNREHSELIPAFHAGDVKETTGAGDALNGGFATALAEGLSPLDAVRFGCATAGLAVTRPGAAASMPTRSEIEQLMAQ